MSENITGGGYSIQVYDLNPDPRPKCYYYRKCGMKVGPWPCDNQSKAKYLAKGFLLEPPIEPEIQKPFYRCQLCGKTHDSLDNLIGCLNSHKEVNHGIS